MERQKACESWWRVCDISRKVWIIGYLGGTHDKSRDFWSRIVLRRSVGSVNSEGIMGRFRGRKTHTRRKRLALLLASSSSYLAHFLA